MKTTVAAILATFAALGARAYTVSENLKLYANTVTVDDKTYVDVLGSGDAKPGDQWGWSKDVVFDGYVHKTSNAWFEPSNVGASSTGAWAGYRISAPKVVTRIRYYARNDGNESCAMRAIGLQFQGANALDGDGDFVDPVTIYTIPDIDSDTLTNGWQDVAIVDPAILSQTFTYLRIYGDYGGNLCEAEFYGCDSLPSATVPPADPAFTSFAAVNGKVSYGSTVAADAYTYRFERKYAGDTEWETIDEHVYVNEGMAINGIHEITLSGPADYRLVAVNAAGESTTTMEVPYYKALTGTVIGSTAEDGSNHAVENVNDGDISTYYKSAEEGGWIGLDLCASKSVCGIRLVPEKGQNWYCQYSKVQVSDDPEFASEGTTSTEELHQSWSGGPDDGFVTLYSFAAISGRYVRFKANNGRYCGVAEIEFLTDEYVPESAPQNLSASSDMDTGNAVLSWDLPSVACMTTRIVRTTAPGGGTDTVTVDLRGNVSTWTDETTIVGVKYYYGVQFVNNLGGVEYVGVEAATTEYCCGAIQIERMASDQSQLRPGMVAIGSKDITNAERLFDGSVAYDSWADGSGDDAKHGKVGVDLGTVYVVTSFKIYPRYQSGWEESWQRSDGMLLAASGSADWASDVHELSAQCEITGGEWFAFDTTNRTPYRYVFLQKNSALTPGYASSFYGNVAELQLFGYPAAALDVLLAPEISSVEWKGSKVKLAWAAAQNATGYRIERKSNDGAWETVATVTATEYTDASIARPTKGTYTYRIASIGGNDSVAYTLSVVPTGTPSSHGLAIIFR
jgi:hypothetical protein